MKALLATIITVLILIAMPWGTKEANDDCLLHPAQVAVWSWFGCNPDQFYTWRDNR